MIILAPNEQNKVVAWNWPWSGDSELVSSSKTLDQSHLEKLNQAAVAFASSIKDFVASTSHETGGLTLTEESSQEDLKEFKARLSRFEVVANPIVSGAATLHEELRSRGIRSPFSIDDPVKGKKVGMDEVYMSLFDTAQSAEEHWDEDAFRRVYLSVMAGRMINLQKGISEWAATYADPEFIQRADRTDPVKDLPEDEDLDVDVPSEPVITPGTDTPGALPESAPSKLRTENRDPEAPYFAGTGTEEHKEHQGKSKPQLRDDVLDALRANVDKLPDDLKAKFPNLVQFFRAKSSLRTAGFQEAVYDKRKTDVSKLLRLFYGGDYERIRDFEAGVLGQLENVWDVEDFPEIEPKTIDDVASAFRDMIDKGDDRGKIMSTLSSMLMKLSDGKEFKLNELVSSKPSLFKSGPMSDAVENVRQTIRGKLSITPRAPAGSGLPKAVPTPAPAPSAAPSIPDPIAAVPSALPKLTAPAPAPAVPAEQKPAPKVRRPPPGRRPPEHLMSMPRKPTM